MQPTAMAQGLCKLLRGLSAPVSATLSYKRRAKAPVPLPGLRGAAISSLSMPPAPERGHGGAAPTRNGE